MLSEELQSRVLEILSDEKATFEKSVQKFLKTFDKHMYFSAGWIIQHLIQYNV